MSDGRKNLLWGSPTSKEQKIFGVIFGPRPRMRPPLPPPTPYIESKVSEWDNNNDDKMIK